MTAHELPVKIYLEDTDAQGIVYHANYLKYCERARTEMLGLAGASLSDWQGRGYVFVVHEMHIRFREPARLHDTVVVTTEVERSSAYRITFKHALRRLASAGAQSAGPLLVQAEAIVVAVGADARLRELPPGLFEGEARA